MSTPSLRSVLYSSGPSDYCGPALSHALRLAVGLGAELTLLRAEANSRRDPEPASVSPVRAILDRWCSGPERDAIPWREVPDAVEVARVVATGGSPLEAAVRYLERHPADLLVLQPGLSVSGARWSRASIQAPMGRRGAAWTLFVGDRGFVDPQTGALTLRNILIPVAPVPEPEVAVEAVETLLYGLGLEPESLTLLWVGDDGARIPRVEPRTEKEWCWRRIARTGRVADEIVRAASVVQADLIAMAMPEMEGPLSLLIRSDTRRVLQEARCPVLAVPGPERLALNPPGGPRE